MSLVALFGNGGYAYVRSAVGFLCKRNGSVNQCEKRMVFTHTHILARIVYGTPLAYYDIARFGELAAKQFNAESLAFGLTAVLRATYSFLVCHLLKMFKR